MGLMNAIGLQPRHPAPSVTSQGTQTPIVQLQNAETQTERELSEPSVPQPAPPTEAPTTSQEAAAAGQRAASQSEASAEDGAPPGGAGAAPPLTTTSVQTCLGVTQQQIPPLIKARTFLGPQTTIEPVWPPV